MSRKGFGCSCPLTATRIVPPRSTTNSRPLPSPALVTNTGLCNPLSTGCNESFTFDGSNATGDGALVGETAGEVAAALDATADGVLRACGVTAGVAVAWPP